MHTHITAMTQNITVTREGLPTEMQALLRDYPRDTWPGHPNFAASIENWMGAHHMFRDLAWLVRRDMERLLDKELDEDVHAERLGHFGNLLIGNLHGHHTWEDRKFLPELRAADRRFVQGLDLLESDHVLLDAQLDRFKTASNRLIQLQYLDPPQASGEAPEVLAAATAIEHLLDQHLADEEDLAVPILLHHKLRG